ncbi:MAG: hypothetical protein ACI9UV_002706 [Algoriphagus sp.]|jgi:hypothetical protein
MSELTEQIKFALAEKSIFEKVAFFPRFFKTKTWESGFAIRIGLFENVF